MRREWKEQNAVEIRYNVDKIFVSLTYEMNNEKGRGKNDQHLC